MSGQQGTNHAAIGFLTVVRGDLQGLLGGYLVLNVNGRPLEFHCTAPIRPNRAQEILYGPTLEPYLYGEQIGQTLLSAAKLAVPLVCTDLIQVLAAAELTHQPLALVLGDAPTTAVGGPPPVVGDVARSAPMRRLDSGHALARPLCQFQVGSHQMALAAVREKDRPQVVAAMQSLGEGFDFSEPFTRIRDAIVEAQRASA